MKAKKIKIGQIRAHSQYLVQWQSADNKTSIQRESRHHNDKKLKEWTYQPNSTKNINIKRLPPLLNTPIPNLLHRLQRPVIHYHTIESSPATRSQFNRFGRNRGVRHVAGKHFNVLGAILVVQGVEGGVCAGD
jgi:hypothetical protein